MSKPLSAGQRVTVWVDRTNEVVDEPTSAEDAFVLAFLGGLLVAVAAAGVLLLTWAGVTRVTMALNYVRWKRNWGLVEPTWSVRS